MASTTRLRIPPSASPEAQKATGTSSVSEKTGRLKLLSFNDMPVWFQRESNPWILSGYRPISGSTSASFYSWSYLHNESVNIYSHLIPAIVFFFGQWSLRQGLTERQPGATSADIVAFSIFMFAAVTCLSLSATYHTMMNHSEHAEVLYLRLDMLGVVVFIVGDLILEVYLIFWCEAMPRYIYWSLAGTFGTLTAFMTLHRKYQGSKYRNSRAIMFVATGFCGLAPLIHGLGVFGVSQMWNKALPHTLTKAVFLLSGVAFYATRYPESRYPGKFDFWGSHAIFHILVLFALVVQLKGYLDAYDYAHENITCPAR